MKYRRAITAAYQLSAHVNSTLLVGHLQSRLLQSVFPMVTARLVIAAAHTSDQDAADKSSLVAATYQSVRFAHSFATLFHGI